MSRSGEQPPRIVCLDKPVGPTSFDLVRRVKRWSRYRRVGHGGTLDPFASGLLVLGLGAATRLLGFLAEGRKSYTATVHFGLSTDSDDATGAPLERGEVGFDDAALEEALTGFVGRIDQRPPALSAIKVDGERSYARVRAGGSAQPLQPRPVDVHAIDLIEFQAPLARISVSCGGGTYIRSLARDLGEALGCPAHLSALRRDAVGPLHLEHAVNPESLEESALDSGSGQPPRGVHAPLAAVADWPRVVLDTASVFRVRQGGQPEATWFDPDATVPDRAALLDEVGELVALCREDDGELRLAMVLGGSHGHP